MRTLDRGDGAADLIFSPDPVGCFRHEKVHGTQRGLADDQAVRALMLAVLEDAIACFESAHAKLAQEAEDWLNSNGDGIFSFNDVCETLGFNPERLKNRVLRWKTMQTGLPAEEKKRLILSHGKCGGKGKMKFKPRHLKEAGSR